MRSALLFVLVTVGCGGRVIDGAGSGWDGVGGVESREDAALDGGAPTVADGGTVPVDTGPATEDTTPSPITPGCGEALWGGARPEIFKSYQFLTNARDCVDGICSIGSFIDASCAMNAQARGESKAVTLSEPDCAWVKRMSTSAAMLNALKEPYACPSAPKGDGAPDLLDVTTTERVYYSKYGAACAEEPLATQKKCILQLVQKYWPEAKL